MQGSVRWKLKSSHRMWNCDDTAFATDVASKRILARRGEKNVLETSAVVQQVTYIYHPLDILDKKMVQPVHYTLYQTLGGWKCHRSSSGSRNYSCLLKTHPVILFIDLSHVRLQIITHNTCTSATRCRRIWDPWRAVGAELWNNTRWRHVLQHLTK